MVQYSKLILILTVLFLFSCSDTAGKVDETDTEIMATLVDTSGNTLANVPVRVYNHKGTEYVDSIQTDANGTFVINTEQLDTFTIWAETDSSGFFRGDIVLEKSKGGYSSTDTLTPFRKIYAHVSLQPQHQNDYKMLGAQILGTHMGAKFLPGPLMELERIPNGTYNIKIAVDDELDAGYQDANEIIDITPFTPDTLTDTIEIPYHGIYTVTGIGARYDTLSGQATISWDKTEYKDIDSYVIYRKDTEGLDSNVRIGRTSDTIFIDTTLTEETPEGICEYRIVILDKDQIREGPFYYDAKIDFKHPKKIFNIIPQTQDTLYLNMEETITLHIDDWFGEHTTASFRLGDATEFTPLAIVDALTLKISDGTYDALPCIVQVTGRDTTVYDTVQLTVLARWNKQAESFYSAGKVQKPVLYNGTYFCSVLTAQKQAVYSSGNGIEWSLLTDSAVVTYDSSWASNITATAEKLWILDGNSLFFSSLDGTTWTQESTTPIKSPWPVADYENRILESRNENLEILFENTGIVDFSDNYKTTDYTYYTYTPGAAEAENSLKDNKKSVFAEVSWINFSLEKGFQLFVYEGKNSGNNPDRAIKLFEIENDRIKLITSSKLDNDSLVYSTWNKTPQLACTNYNGGLFLQKGMSKEIDLFYPNGGDWQPNSTIEFKESPVIDELFEEPNTTVFTTTQGLVVLTPKGVFTDFQ